MCSYFFLGIIEPCMQDSIRGLESVSLLPARCGPLLIRTEQPDVGRPTQMLIDPERLCCEGQVDREREREGRGKRCERAETLRSPLRNAGDDRSRHAKHLPIINSSTTSAVDLAPYRIPRLFIPSFAAERLQATRYDE